MSEQILVAFIAVTGVLGGAAIAWLTASQARTWHRLEQAETANHALWRYTRHLIDELYRANVSPPEPPSEIAHLYNNGGTL